MSDLVLAPSDQLDAEPSAQTLVLEDFPSPALARALSPNGRGHWARRHEAKRDAAHRLACESLLQRIVPVDGPVRLLFRWVFPSGGRHDLDNLIATAKPLIDALVTAGVLTDDDSRHVVGISAEVSVERGRRALEIVLAPVAEQHAGERGAGLELTAEGEQDGR